MTLIQVLLPKSKPKDLTFLKSRIQNRDSTSAQKKPVLGIDTETDNGNIFLIADSDGSKLEYPNITFENVAKYLLKREDFWIFFYNLGFDAECILKLLPKEILEPYKINKRLEFQYGVYHIFYIPNKKLTIRKGNHSVSCYDIAQYYDNMSLVDAYKKHIGKKFGSQYLQTKKKREFFSTRQFRRNKKEIRKYCIQDCILTKELSENWIETFFKTFGFYPRNWLSSGYLAEKVLIYNGVDVPYFYQIQYPIQSLAWKSFYGGRFELIQRGFIGKCYLYDINSAYPNALCHIPDITNGKWVDSNKIHPLAELGFFRIHAQVEPSVKVAPFPFRTKNGRIIYPTGEFETYVTLEELKAVIGDSRIKYRIIDSYQFIPNTNCKYPFEKFIEDLYYKRLKLKKENNSLERAIKIILNSVYGKTAQRVNNRIGNLFAPVIASYITGYTRAQLYNFMRENNLEKEVVAFATDSVACRKKIPGLDSEKLGEMKLDKEGNDAYFLSNGFYRFNGKWKKRGIGYDREKNVEFEHKDTRIENGKIYLIVKTRRITHIKSGILFNKIEKIGKFEEYEKKLDLNSDKKRFWSKELTSLAEETFCDSVPIPINLDADLISKNELGWIENEDYHPESEI